MAGKGSGNGCCCTGCEEVPFTAPSVANQPINPGTPLDPISFAGYPVDLGQAFCCSCLPKAACVAVTCYDSGSTSRAIFDLRCGLNGEHENGTAILYSGTIAMGEEDVDLEFSIIVEDGLCYFSLTSYALNLFDDRKLVDADSRAAPQFFCQTLTNNPLNIGEATAIYPTEWLAAGAGCGLVAVTIGRDDLTPITKRRVILDADTGVAVIDDSPIKNICRGCGCICTNACISLQYPRENIVIHGTVPLTSENTGTAECPHVVTQNYYELTDPMYGIKISVVANGDDNDRCALLLESTGYALTLDGVLLWPIVDDTGTDCPHPSAIWQVTDADGYSVIVRFDCATCGECTVTGTTGCCSGISLPRVIHCTIEKNPDVPSSFCECLPLTIPMVYQGGITPSWYGLLKSSVGNNSWCFPVGTNDVAVQLSCTGLGWQLRFGTENWAASPCAGTLYNPTLTCEPLEMIFESIQSCCGMGGPSSIILTITE